MTENSIKSRALAALMECRTFTEVADMVGVNRRTIYRYLHDDDEFIKEYKMLIQEKVILEAENAQIDEDKAKKVIHDILGDETQKAEVRLKAAQLLLNLSASAKARLDSVLSEQERKSYDPFDVFGSVSNRPKRK